MKVETVLPFGKLDPGLRPAREPLDVTNFYEQARRVEAIGYDALSVTETKLDPFVQLTLAAQATERIELHSAVAIAFPRSPTVTAQAAWTLQALSEGRLNLGLGTQVKGHIERRFGLGWHPAGPWLREYVEALREVWSCWQEGRQPDHHGDVYDISLMVPLFDPGPLEHPDIPVTLAAVKPFLCQIAGAVADGLRPHPICTPEYIESVMLPAVGVGADAAGRSVTDVDVMVAPLIATAADQAGLAVRMEEVRARVAFYASTPSYRPAFDAHGLTDLSIELAQLSKAQRWDEMPRRIDDDVLRTYACVGTHDEIVDIVRDRYAALVRSTEFSIPITTPDEEELLASMVAGLQA